MSFLIIRQYSEGYDKVEPLHVSDKFRVIDLCGYSAARDYLSDIGYTASDDDAYLVNRAVKFLPNPNYKLKIYLDASINISRKDDFEHLIETHDNVNSDLFFCRHPHRTSIYEEINTCYRLSKIDKKSYNDLTKRNDILTNKRVLTQNGFHISRYSSDTWFWGGEFIKFLHDNEIKRDQICLPIFLDKYPSPKIHLMDWPSFLQVKSHNETILKKVRKKWYFWVRR